MKRYLWLLVFSIFVTGLIFGLVWFLETHPKQQTVQIAPQFSVELVQQGALNQDKQSAVHIDVQAVVTRGQLSMSYVIENVTNHTVKLNKPINIKLMESDATGNNAKVLWQWQDGGIVFDESLESRDITFKSVKLDQATTASLGDHYLVEADYDGRMAVLYRVDRSNPQ